ncbi:hypothetical protein JCM10207_003472 [Rhodosporidiobolus poonsookiae]
MHSPSPQAFAAHLLARVQSDLAFLHAQQILPQADYELISARLAAVDTSGMVKVEQGMAALSVKQEYGQGGGMGGQGAALPPSPPVRGVQQQGKRQCRAVWDYNKSQPDDLGFKTGDIITIEEEVNGDWWKGSLNGQTGLFPSNHVEPLSATAPPPPPSGPSPSGYSTSYHAPPPPSHHAPPPPPQQHWTPPPPAHSPYAYAQPQGYGAPAPAPMNEKQGMYGALPPPPPPQQQQPQQPQYVVQQPAPTVEEGKKGKFGKFGKQMGTAFAGGAGFGAGSALTSNAINAIF